MMGAVQILLALTVLLCTSFPSRALPINGQDDTTDALTLIANGLLSQEKRLQAVEQQLLSMSSVPAPVGRARTRGMGRLQVDDRDIETRVKHLEEDLGDHTQFSEYQLRVVRDQLKELQRRESEHFLNMHSELEKDVNILENEVNASFERAEQDISAIDDRVDHVDTGVKNNVEGFNHLRNGLIHTKHYLEEQRLKLDDRVYELELKLKNIMEQLMKIQKEHDKESQEPGVGPVGNTGGIQSYPRIMSASEQALREWIRTTDARASSFSRAQSVHAKPLPASFEELLQELKNTNM